LQRFKSPPPRQSGPFTVKRIQSNEDIGDAEP